MSIDMFINYVELLCRDIFVIKVFFVFVFNWIYIDYGEEYCEFCDKGIIGGLYKVDMVFFMVIGVMLLVFYIFVFEEMLNVVMIVGGIIIKFIFVFFGGWWFYFIEFSGNEFVVWLDK